MATKNGSHHIFSQQNVHCKLISFKSQQTTLHVDNHVTLAALKDVMRQLMMTLFATVRSFAVCPSLMITLVVALEIVSDL